MTTHTKIIAALLLLLLSLNTYSIDRRGRLGAGFSNQLKNGVPSLSFKLQKSKAFAIGGLLSYSTNENGGGHGAAIKLYRNLFDEPQLNFYASATAGIIKKSINASTEQSGFQADFTLGSEFSFTGLQSLGFSVEFGASINKLDDFVLETTGNSFIVSGIHFYL